MDKVSKRQHMRMAEDIMAEDREILRALATTEVTEQMQVARDVMKRRRSALKKLAE